MTRAKILFRSNQALTFASKMIITGTRVPERIVLGQRFAGVSVYFDAGGLSLNACIARPGR